MAKPLDGILVIDFSQFLSGPSASLKLADLGARVIKIERPETGDICRDLYVSNVEMNGDSTVFHAINRNKESFVADLKDKSDCREVRKLIQKSDVVLHNFRPGVMDRLGFDYASVREINPDIIYGEISGYGDQGPWRKKPGQDLLVQALAGLTWLSGNRNKGPVPMGLSIVDILTGSHLAQGILACLVRRGINNTGGLVQVSMLETAIDLQFETISTFYLDGGEEIQRSVKNNAHAYLGAPYGLYETEDGYIALAMGEIPKLGALTGCNDLLRYTDPSQWYEKRDEIKSILADHLRGQTTEKWLNILKPADVWCADVLSWNELMESKGFKMSSMIQQVVMDDGFTYKTTRCPISIDGELLVSSVGAPRLGKHTQHIINEMSDSKS